MAAPQPLSVRMIAPINIGSVQGLYSPPKDQQLTVADRQLKQLARLIEVGCAMVETLDPNDRQVETRQSASAKMLDFQRLTDSIRKLMALEQYTTGIRDKRFQFVREHWLMARKAAVRQSVEQAIVVSQPELEPRKRENLLADLFYGYGDLARYEGGSLRDMVAGICETLGVTADLSIWDEPAGELVPADIVLPAGHDWIVPHNGDRPYTIQTTPDGRRIRVHWNGPEMCPHGNDPPWPE